MLVDVAGRQLVSRKTLELSRAQVRWFLNGKAFLRHLHDLGQVKIAAYCQVCYEKGRPDAVWGRPRNGSFVVGCGHCEYWLNWDLVTDTDTLLRRMGWSLRCAGDCEKLGMYDGVQGNNDPQRGTVEVSCGCTDRKYVLPVTKH